MRRDALPLWQPGPDELAGSHLARFARANGFDPADYDTLHRWSISDLDGFWNALWDYAGVIGERGEVALQRAGDGEMFAARWYPQASLNFAENLLVGDDARLALIEANETGVTRRITMGELRALVARAQRGLRQLGVVRGDCVAGILPNNVDALVALLASASLGAVWASCSPDFGAPGIIDRVGQVHPKVLVAARSYVYNGKRFSIDDNLRAVLAGMSGVRHLVLTDDDADQLDGTAAQTLTWRELCAGDDESLRFERVPFAHPLYVMFTSGTTGLPKGIVHTTGGVLLQHRKEHLLHADVRPGDVMSWYTNTAWMMYHWLISGLASHAALVLYDGAPIVTRDAGLDHGVLWRVAEAAGTTHFGTSPRYLGSLAESGYEPGRQHDLGRLRSVLSAGAPVAPEQFDWLYRAVKQNMMFASISGGTEINGCFVLGSPLHPVYRGEIACKGLGLAVDVLDERGASVIGRKGDLVCTQPFPSAPLTFWGDNGDARYRAAYFDARPDIWTHGDLAEQTLHGAVIIYGRSDTTLKPGGVRIGTAEIYRVIDTQPEIQDCLVFGRPVGDDEEIVLCVVMKDGLTLDAALADRLRADVRRMASPRHVPRHIHQVSAVPYTINGKRVEGAARSVVAGVPVKNLGSLANPECLAEFAALYEKESV
ncbi:acetoacetate--CoA ligase [Paraburkholderia silvatlantica]|uniref:acetoacetate--CoA ligase n=1 Tax=Paraburkholderia silvatlantica TaxID=321895 RepID=UPI0037508160